MVVENEGLSAGAEVELVGRVVEEGRLFVGVEGTLVNNVDEDVGLFVIVELVNIVDKDEGLGLSVGVEVELVRMVDVDVGLVMGVELVKTVDEDGGLFRRLPSSPSLPSCRSTSRTVCMSVRKQTNNQTTRYRNMKRSNAASLTVFRNHLKTFLFHQTRSGCPVDYSPAVKRL